jgi:hypothetical protein
VNDFSNRDYSEDNLEFAERLLMEFAAEEEMVRYAEDLPWVRPSLKAEFVSSVDMWDRRHEQFRRLPITLALMLIAFFTILSVSSNRSVANAVAENVPEQPLGDRYSLSGQLDPAILESANQDTDSWAMVEAFNLDRVQRSRNLRRGLGSQ